MTITPTTMRRVSVNTAGDQATSINAWLYGEWAAHKAIGRNGWTVTYLPSGRDLGDRQFNEAQARRCASWLDQHVTRDEMLDWSAPSAEVRARIYKGIEMTMAGGKEMAS